MSELQSGTLVKHVSLGVGKIVAVEASAVHVFFPDADKRFAAKLRLPAARAMLRIDGFEPNAWLEGLSAFSLDAASGRYALAASWLTHEQALAQFLAIRPEGFAAPAGGAASVKDKGRDERGRAARWRAAHEAWSRTLGREEAGRLVEEGEVETLVRRALAVEKLVAPLHPQADEGVVAQALSDEAAARSFLLALVELLAVPSPGRARFDKLFAAARGLPVDPAHQWLVATLFPFVAAPDRHVLLRPRVTCLAAERLGCDLRYEPAPNWTTYATVRAVAERLLERLKPEGAADFVDVESFLHVIATSRRSTAGAQGGRQDAARARAAGGRARR